jgi:hypothetical protein
MKTPQNEVVNRFYENPGIKYLGSSGLFRKPSSINPESFSKTLIDELSGGGQVTGEKLNTVLKISALATPESDARGGQKGALDRETAGYIYSLWQDAGEDIAKFIGLLEDWFNRTMEQATEWYKRKIQLVLLILGFCLAWFFCADTFLIVKNLSIDKKAREQMVSMANTYIQSGLPVNDTSLLDIKRKLDADIVKANTVLGMGGWLPDKVKVTLDTKSREKVYTPLLDPRSLSATDQKISNGTLSFTFAEKLGYLLRLGYHHFFGLLITAVAISLGAPFWFDLLNKMMQLRTSLKTKGETDNPHEVK